MGGRTLTNSQTSSRGRFGAIRLNLAARSGAFIIAVAITAMGIDYASADPASDKYSLIPTPIVTGPVASEDFSSPTKNYEFFKTDVALQPRGYVEEEFFVEGKANAYDTPTIDFKSASNVPIATDVKVITADVPYKTRYVVRRPSDPAKFNGTVVVEWLNVTDNYDGEYVWAATKDNLLRSGYAYIGISAQNNGISNTTSGLKTFSPTRYGSIDVTGQSSIAGDALSYDIFSQAAKAARSVPVLLKGLPVKNVMGIGMSQSAARMGVYLNQIHGRAPIYDSMLLAVWTPAIRDDLNIPVIKVLSETETKDGRLATDRADTPLRKTYWVASTAHGDATQRIYRTAIRNRDLGPASVGADACGPNGATPTRTRTPIGQVWSSAIDHLKRQMDTGAVPPSAPRLVKAEGTPLDVARDADGNALGGIRLAGADVPIARMHGTECGNVGAWVPYTTAKLQALYPSHDAYVAKVTSAVNASVASGFVLPEDGARTIAEAKASIIGTGLESGPLCLSVGHSKPASSSTGLLRDRTAYYDPKDNGDILKAVDQAHRSMAMGYSTTGEVAKKNFCNAVTSLYRYIDLMRTAQSDGQMTATAATALIGEANAIISSTGEL
jgi:hypothetical protein